MSAHKKFMKPGDTEPSNYKSTPFPQKQWKKPSQTETPSNTSLENNLNKLGARLIKAELLGNKKLALEIQAELESLRNKESSAKVLQKVDREGNVTQVDSISRTESDYGIVYSEKHSSFDYARNMAKRGRLDDVDLGDFFTKTSGKLSALSGTERQDITEAIKQHKVAVRAMEECQLCLTDHMRINTAQFVYLSVPAVKSLVDGHCLLVAVEHEVSARGCSESTFAELAQFKAKLVRFFADSYGLGVLFMETVKRMSSAPHMSVECVPIHLDVSPLIYFKKALMECEGEWSMNRKVVDYRGKSLRSVIPTGFPYFAVELGEDGGFAHVIEDERMFSGYFGKEVVAGIVGADLDCWRNPRLEEYPLQKRKADEFRRRYSEWEQRLDYSLN